MARDRSFWLTALAVAGVFVFALFVRTYWNVEAATPAGTFVLSESDAYYHHHSIERIQTSGWSHPISDPLVNYPLGGVNPNPPLFDWWVATWGAMLSPLFAGDAANHAIACPAGIAPSQAVCVSTWFVTLFSPALFGAFTVLLVVLIGREVWNWRAGLLAGFLAATSTSHIERSVFGFADHDSFVLFFIVLMFLFFVKALNRARQGRWVEHFGDLHTVRAGLGAYARANHLSIAYALIAGVALAGVGLSWKGSAYAAGIVLAYGVVQVLVNHWRRKDSTHVFLTVGIVQLVNVLLILPYYGNPALRAVGDTLLPMAFIALAWVLLGLVFTAARDLPFVLVLPASIVAGLVALLIAFVVAPSVAQTLLAPLVYFKQTKLYTTIAEAHAADFNTVVFGTGVVGFFFALAAIPYLLWVNRKTWQPAWTLMAIWGIVAIFMTHSAVRFMFNATPVFALLGGWGASLVVQRLRFETIGKNLAGLGGISRDALRRAVNVWHVVGAVLLALLLVLPNVMLAVDAGMPSQTEDKLIRGELAAKGLPFTEQNRAETFVGHRMGAFGQGFISDYWRALFEWLQTQDTHLPEAQRPAFLSWWDYGHWALSLGRHPAVADNFQNGFQFAGDFIVAQNETHAVQLFMARMADNVGRGQASEDVFLRAFQAQGLSDADSRAALGTLRAYGESPGAHGYTPLMNLTQSVAALEAIESQLGQRIRYFAVDVRLFPFDNPATPGVDFGSIFYAPVTLSDHNPDDFVEAVVRASVGGQPSREYSQPEWNALQRDPRTAANINPNSIHPIYKYKEPFFNSMFYRTYLGTPVGLSSLPVTSCATAALTYPLEGDSLPGLPMPAFCMEHFRLVYYDANVRMIKYYPGAVVHGKVTVDGQPVAGARVLAYDDAGDLVFAAVNASLTDTFKAQFKLTQGRDPGPRDFDIPHAETTTAADGSYRLLVPFSTTGHSTVRAFKDDAELGNRSFPVSVEQAERGHVFDPAMGAIDATSGSVQGKVYQDANGNGAFDAGEGLAGASVSLDGDAALQGTSGPDGAYTIPGVAPGRHQVLATLAEYAMSTPLTSSFVSVDAGKAATFDIAMRLQPATLAGAVWQDANGDGARGEVEGRTGVTVKAVPDFRTAPNTAQELTAVSREAGNLSGEIAPGSYVVRGQWLDPATGEGYAFGTALDVARGAAAAALPENATRLVRATPATLNLTFTTAEGDSRAAAGASVLFVPTTGGLPAAERAPVNGTLSLQLVPGTYQVHARVQSGGDTYQLAPAMTLVVGTDPVSAEARLTKV